MRDFSGQIGAALCVVGLMACAAEVPEDFATHTLALRGEGIPATRDMFPAPPLPEDVDDTPLDVAAVLAVQAAAPPPTPAPAAQDRCTTDLLPPGAPQEAGPSPDPHARPHREPERPYIEASSWEDVASAHPEARAELTASFAELRARAGAVDTEIFARDKLAVAIEIETRWGTALYVAPEFERTRAVDGE